MSGMTRLWLLVLPELGQFAVPDRDAALRKAGETRLDILELIGMAFGLVLVTAATQYALPDQSTASRFSAAILNFIVAMPLVGLAVAPFHIRRLRRGLRAQLKQLEQLKKEHE
jgi:hypothetical protein